MRLRSLFIPASVVLFTCFPALSTVSSSTLSTLEAPDIPTQRFLRNGTDTNEEERVLNIPDLSKVTESFNSMPSKVAEKMLYWVLRASRKSANNAYTFLRLDKAGGNLKTSLRFKVWNMYLAKMLVVLDKNQAKQDVVPKVQSALLDIWGANKLTASEVFTLLRLNQPRKQVNNILLRTWVKHVKSTERLPELAMTTVIAGYDDATRVVILEGLRKIELTEDVTSNIENHLMSAWAQEKKSADQVFTALRLDRANGGSLSSNPNIGMWAKYVGKTPGTLSDSTITMVSNKYRDIGLVDMLEAFAKAEVSQDVIIRVQSKLLTMIKGKKMSAAGAFTLLKLDRRHEDLVTDTLLRTWVKYVEMTSSMSDLAIGTVVAGHDFAIRVMILEGLEKIEGTENIVNRLRASHKLETSSAFQTLQILNLDGGLKNTSPDVLSITDMIRESRKFYGDITLAVRLEEAWKEDGPTGKTVYTLRTEMFRQWMTDKTVNLAKIPFDSGIQASYDTFLALEANKNVMHPFVRDRLSSLQGQK